MAIVPTREGRMEDLKLMLSKDLVLHLFVNDFVPDYDSTLEDFEEADKDSYLQFTLKSNAWKYASSPRDNPVALHAEVSFEFLQAGFAVHGWYITDKAGKIVRWAERFPKGEGPFSVLRQGDILKVVPKIELTRPKKEE